jgi:hypothetical protein
MLTQIIGKNRSDLDLTKLRDKPTYLSYRQGCALIEKGGYCLSVKHVSVSFKVVQEKMQT